MENTGRATVRCERTVPIRGISSNGIRIPEKNICGMKIMGRKLIAMFTFREKTLMHNPRSAPAPHATHSREPLCASK